MVFNPKTIKSGKYNVFISEGGISVLTNPGTFSTRIKPPKDVSKLSNEQLQNIADEATVEWENWIKGF